MNNVDLIIKYLSDEMSLEEAATFEKEMASSGELKDEFEEVSSAWYLIRDQLRTRDEEAFRKKLMEIIERPVAKPGPSGYLSRSKWYFLLPLAASVAILLAIFLINRGSDRILSHFYHPEKDQVILAMNQGTRGDIIPGLAEYRQGEFGKAMEILSKVLDREPDNQLASLYYLLTSMETDMQEKALDKLGEVNLNNEHHLEQALSWYTALALVKSNRNEEAVKILLPLIQKPGPYQSDAERLQKILLK